MVKHPGNAMYALAGNVDQTTKVLPPRNTLVAEQRLPDGSCQLAFYGEIGQQYTLFASTNFVSWVPVTDFLSTNLPFLLRDAAATDYSQRFYRAVMP
ncbi:MAG: hypothetical protein HY674_18850 [Chloroflexi bacterium]|nr:hypothetical protein [Chloroflexota bacterium]